MRVQPMGARKNFILWALSLAFLAAFAHASAAVGALRPLEYAETMNGVLGAADRTAERSLQRLWDGTLRILDALGPDYKELTARFPWFKEKAYEQNLLFHWGWGIGPAKHAALQKQAEQDIRAYAIAQHIPPQDVNAFLKDQKKEFSDYLRERVQKRQEGELTNAVAQYLGIPRNRNYAQSMAAVLYNLHLLAEYTASPSAPMPRLEDIEKSLADYLKRLLTRGDNAAKRRRGDAIERDLREARRVNGNNKTKAQAMMRAVHQHLPAILNEGFQKEMRSKNVTLR